MSLMGQQRPINAVDDESGLPPTADELLHHGKRRKGPDSDIGGSPIPSPHRRRRVVYPAWLAVASV